MDVLVFELRQGHAVATVHKDYGYSGVFWRVTCSARGVVIRNGIRYNGEESATALAKSWMHEMVIATHPAKESASIIAEVTAELAQAEANWPPFNSAHEGYAVLLEEVDELWELVKVNQKRHDKVAMRNEAKQIAAMALRFMRDCC